MLNITPLYGTILRGFVPLATAVATSAGSVEMAARKAEISMRIGLIYLVKFHGSMAIFTFAIQHFEIPFY